MSTKFIEQCPSCGGKMSITTLGCKDCGIEIKGDFELPIREVNQLPLDNEELLFVKTFLKYEGNISKLQDELGLGYFAIKGKLKSINIKLGNEEEEEMTEYNGKVELEGKGKASQKIIDLLNKSGGKAYCSMLRGEPLQIWLTPKGVKNSGFPDLLCEWEIIDAIVEKAKELGGKMYRGDGAAQNGAKIGSNELPLDTIDAFIGLKYYGASVGKATTRRSTYYAAILAWAEICKNCRSDGKGGFIFLNPEWR
jgi:hypothetical protein